MVFLSSPGNSPFERGDSSLFLKGAGGGGGCLNLQPAANPSNLAYVIYTSGSSGRPKGVMVRQGNVNNLVWGLQKRVYHHYTNDRSRLNIALVAPFVFDASVKQVFAALLLGHRLSIVPEDIRVDGAGLVEFYNRCQIEISDGTPAHLLLLLETLKNTREPKGMRLPFPIRHFLIGGDALTREVAEELLYYLEKYTIKITNVYGPTECCVDATTYEITKENVTLYSFIPIGRPMPNQHIYILDKALKFQPVGIPGEIYIAGDSVARGYLNNPALTEKKFIPNPFIPPTHIPMLNDRLPMTHLYKTGDLARWLLEGYLEFLGRIDQQVKIRGFRIELGEIESQLQKHDKIKETVVIAKKDTNRDNYLCAFLVPILSGTLDDTELRQYLSMQLPDYMIPSFFVQMEKLPLTPNGKLNIRALPEPGVSSEKEYEAPVNWVEGTLSRIWSEILGIEKSMISRNANFFALGGHSLKATLMTSKIHKAFDVKVPLAEIFKSPRIKELSKYIRKAAKDKYAALEPVEKKDYYVLSSAQTRLYVLQQLALESIGYNMWQVIEIEEEPDRERMEHAFKKLIQRHESLRTSFHMINDQPVQRIHDTVEFTIEYYDLASGGSGRGIRPFDLAKVPLLRVGLMKRPHTTTALPGHPSQEEKGDRYLLMMDMHHIISDAFSREVLVRDFIRLYNGEELPPLRLRYKAYAEWQVGKIKRGALKQQEAYWLKQFAGEIAVLDLPYDYTRPAVQGFEGSTVKFGISGEETGALNKMSLEQGVTLFMMLLAVTNVFLAKLSSQQDIVIGSPIAGRRHADLEQVIGMFVNTLAMRNYPEREKTFREFLKEVKNRALEAFENQEYPFERLVDQAAVVRDVSRNPLFDVMFSLQNIDANRKGEHRHKHPGNRQMPNEHENIRQTSAFDLSIDVTPGDRLFFSFEYSTKLFKKQAIESFIIYFKKIISTVIKDLDTIISRIEIIPWQEKKQILVDFNNTGTQYPADQVIHRLFETQVDKNPGKIAAITNDKNLTFHELNLRSNRLARWLRGKGVKPETIVSIMMERSLEMIIGVWATQKAGGAYLPLDLSYPTNRLEYMMAHSGVHLLLTQTHLKCPMEVVGEIIYLDDNPPNMDDKEGGNLESVNKPQDLAYVIYTSGSTGKPKCVMVQNNHYVNAVFAWRKEYRLEEIEINLLQLAAFSFDVFAGDLARALLNGGKLVICPQDVKVDLEALYELIRRHRISLFESTPSLIIPLMDYVEENQLEIDNLKLLILGSDICAVEDFKRLFSHYGENMRIINSYGVTEATIDTSCFDGHMEHTPLSGNVPIGKPLANMMFYVMDAGWNLQPQGIPGELYIGGRGVARGYLNYPGLTAEKFVRTVIGSSKKLSKAVNEQWPMTNDRLYRTGDLARWLPDGNIEFLGRVDHQVKIRGYRIESGEIENRLLKYPLVKEAVVVAKEYKSGDKYLCAYIQVSSSDTPSVPRLKEYLAKDLPGYMMPSHFVFMPEMPLTPNGKIHRSALPDPTFEAVEDYATPRDKLEEKLVEIWGEVLSGKDVSQPSQLHAAIGIDDNFFQLGGHSLKATMLVSKIHKELKVKVPLVEVFRTPTIRDLACYIKGVEEETYISIVPAEKKEYYVLSAAQRRLYALQQMYPEDMAYNIRSQWVTQGSLDKGILEGIFMRLIQRHESLRTSFIMVENEPVQKIHDDEAVFEIRQFASATDMEENCVRSFDLSKTPLMHMGIIKIDEQSYLLRIDIHHIIYDAVSEEVLIQDFSLLDKGGTLPPLRIQYKDYSRWQNRLFHSEEIKKQEAYWLKQFENPIPLINLTTDYPRPSFKSFAGSAVDFQLGKEDTTRLDNMALEVGGTLYMVLLAIYNVFLAKISRQEDIAVGTAAAGRRHADLIKLVGMFVNTLALRNYPKGNKIFNNFLKEVKTRTLDAFENQDYQFDDLVENVAGNRDISRNPIFDVSFAFQDVRTQPAQKPTKETTNVDQAQVGFQINTAKFDLTLRALAAHQGISFALVYSTDLFKEKTIKLMAAWFQNILKQVLASPNNPIYTYQLSSGTEKELYHYLGVSQQEIECIYPIVPTQRDIYLDCKINPEAKAHRMIYYYVMEKPIDIKTWKESLHHLYRVYPILRALLVGEEDNCYLGIRREVEIDFEYMDWTGANLVENEIEQKIKEMTRPVTHALDQGLVKHYLVELAGTRFVDVLSIHHIIFDGPSLKIFFEKFHEVYKASLSNPGCYKEEIKDHGVFINFQQSMLEKFDTPAVENYWKKRFSNVQKLQGTTRTAASHVLVSHQLLIEVRHLERIRAYCRQLNISVPLYFRALYALLTRFYFGVEEDFITREIFAGRNEYTRDFVGCFFHTIPMVFTQQMFASKKKISQYFRDVFTAVMKMSGKQHISILMQNHLLGEQDMTFYYNFRDFLKLEISNRDYYLNRVVHDSDGHYHPGEVQLITKNIEEGFFLELDYNPGYFNGERFLDRLLSISEQVLGEARHLGDIYFFTREELQEILDFSTGPAAGYPSGTPLFRLYREHAEKNPHNSALHYEDRQLTYRQLNEASNQLAHYLVKHHRFQQGHLAGILMERSFRMVESIIATWKAGGAYIPIDPAYPPRRILQVLNDSGAAVLISQSQQVPVELERDWNGNIIHLDRQKHNASKQGNANPDLDIDMRSLAYVIYTSGSTGKPKGAMVEHIGMMNHIQAKINALELTARSVVAQNASHTFDISVWQFFVALAVGGTTVIYPNETIMEPGKFLTGLTKNRVNILEVVPSYLSVMLEAAREMGQSGHLPLNYLLVTGETVKPELVNQWFEIYPGIKMVNAYGPTEASDDITHHIMEKAPQLERVPLGKPIQNLDIYIVDNNGQLCPIGIKGEIWVAGVGVGRGYLNNPELTNSRFQVTNQKVPGKRIYSHMSYIYKTGDLAGWHPDGNIDFFGRKDFQVKIRGFRIELGEIENQLLRHPSIKEAVVINREISGKSGPRESSDEYLCGYIVPHRELDQDKLVEYLSAEVPDYMIPSCFVQIGKIPLTPNGKIDRKALPYPGKKDLEPGIRSTEPTNRIEETLVEIWENVLGREPIGINENFFLLGGDSIKAIQIVSRISKWGYKLEIRDIFQYPLVEKLAARVKKLERTADQSLVTGRVALTPIQVEFFSKSNFVRHHYNQALMFYSRSGIDPQAIKAVFTRIQEHHDALRMCYPEGNGEIIQVNRGLDIPLTLPELDYRDQHHESAVAALERTANEIQASIQLQTGPLVKLTLFHLDDGDRLLIVIHHLVIDGISWRILVEDIETLHQQYMNEEPLVLPLKTDSFKSWAEQLSRYANRSSFLKESPYWEKLELEGLTIPPIKKDFHRENDKKNETHLSVTLGTEETEQLLTEVHEAFGTEINDILLTALGISIRKTYERTRVLIALEAHGREEIIKGLDITRTVGWFTCWYPVILDMSNENDLSLQIKKVKESLHQVPHKGIGYGILKFLTAKEAKKEIQFKLKPQICFNFLGQVDTNIEQVSFGIARESKGNSESTEGLRNYELEVSGMITNKQLVISIGFNKNQFKRETLERLLMHYKKEIRGVIAHCVSRENKELTPSDFTYKELSIEEVGAIHALFDR